MERLWPRGMTRERAALTLWLKEVAPSPELRKWYAHDASRWGEFRQRYWAELGNNQAPIADLKQYLEKGTMTFVYAAADERYNSAVALKEFLELKVF